MGGRRRPTYQSSETGVFEVHAKIPHGFDAPDQNYVLRLQRDGHGRFAGAEVPREHAELLPRSAGQPDLHPGETADGGRVGVQPQPRGERAQVVDHEFPGGPVGLGRQVQRTRTEHSPELPGPRCAVARSDPGGYVRFNPRGGALRPDTGLPVHHLRRALDPEARVALRGLAQPDDPPARPGAREGGDDEPGQGPAERLARAGPLARGGGPARAGAPRPAEGGRLRGGGAAHGVDRLARRERRQGVHHPRKPQGVPRGAGGGLLVPAARGSGRHRASQRRARGAPRGPARPGAQRHRAPIRPQGRPPPQPRRGGARVARARHKKSRGELRVAGLVQTPEAVNNRQDVGYEGGVL
mmetsp:Transcript_60092/g.135870  ORF Transcript_60092/g.135870 Transcript_60092/m.135870 type:complete len:354 (+) Transcript_60092:452-1513(+)